MIGLGLAVQNRPPIQPSRFWGGCRYEGDGGEVGVTSASRRQGVGGGATGFGRICVLPSGQQPGVVTPTSQVPSAQADFFTNAAVGAAVNVMV